MAVDDSCQPDATLQSGLFAAPPTPAQDSLVADPADTQFGGSDSANSMDSLTEDLDMDERSNHVTHSLEHSQATVARAGDGNFGILVIIVLLERLGTALTYSSETIRQTTVALRETHGWSLEPKADYDDYQRTIEFVTAYRNDHPKVTARAQMDTAWADDIISRSVAENIPQTSIQYFPQGPRTIAKVANKTRFRACGTITLTWRAEGSKRHRKSFWIPATDFTTRFYVSEQYDLDFAVVIGRDTCNKHGFLIAQGMMARRLIPTPPKKGYIHKSAWLLRQRTNVPEQTLY
ncbi:hypothetical protein W97_03570 [Coniosporium apollinis CBS 100218]|uniref:Uncharacterized protein n=1 Tax=Coniosporium apollinis (strain CBS 100218) TaxID=1168221 RepID=R7YRA7_CONA1|nr:uncharacterized protein W97_03570 [Coniosporium apollinis CBS 100218]EON64339.1 hypothetical protein W97_03570 [Coniosporium apollinis CBS 100218]